MEAIGIDLMGSDASPSSLFPAIQSLHQALPFNQPLALFAPAKVLQELRLFLGEESSSGRWSWFEAESVISMSDPPLSSLRSKRQSSLCLAIRSLRSQKIGALVSGGNTGALIACSALELPPFSGVERPALLASIPTSRHPIHVLDVGGRVSATSDQLFQWACLGAGYHLCSGGTHRPKVALLNVGEEALKGHSVVREAYERLERGAFSSFDFVGNVEAKELFRGGVDVLVTDGFTGNVFLKTAEGVADFVLSEVAHSLPSPQSSSVRAVQRLVDHSEHPGALVCGVEGLVIKCHGKLSGKSLTSAVWGARRYLEKQIIHKLGLFCAQQA